MDRGLNAVANWRCMMSRGLVDDQCHAPVFGRRSGRPGSDVDPLPLRQRSRTFHGRDAHQTVTPEGQNLPLQQLMFVAAQQMGVRFRV